MRATVRAGLGSVLAVGLVVGGASAASADHTHFRVVGNGDCVLLAADGHEKDVVLPYAEEQGYAPNRSHPLHVNVHLGQPGQVGAVYVAYTASGVLTPEAHELCDGSFRNG